MKSSIDVRKSIRELYLEQIEYAEDLALGWITEPDRETTITRLTIINLLVGLYSNCRIKKRQLLDDMFSEAWHQYCYRVETGHYNNLNVRRKTNEECI